MDKISCTRKINFWRNFTIGHELFCSSLCPLIIYWLEWVVTSVVAKWTRTLSHESTQFELLLLDQNVLLSNKRYINNEILNFKYETHLPFTVISGCLSEYLDVYLSVFLGIILLGIGAWLFDGFTIIQQLFEWEDQNNTINILFLEARARLCASGIGVKPPTAVVPYSSDH